MTDLCIIFIWCTLRGGGLFQRVGAATEKVQVPMSALILGTKSRSELDELMDYLVHVFVEHNSVTAV